MCLAPLALGVALIAKGVLQFLIVPNAGFDFRLLWTATHYYLRGVNPFEASFYFADVHRGVTPAAMPTFLPDLGWPEQVNYPPTSTLAQIVFFGLPWAWARVAYLGLNAASSAVLAIWASQFAHNLNERLLLAGVVVLNLGLSQTILNGNQGILALALLVGAVTLRRQWPMAAGLCLAMALVKPTITGPFVLLFIVERRYRVLASCAVVLAASVALTVRLSHTGVVTLVRETLEGTSRFATGGFAIWKAVRAAGLGGTMALGVSAATVLVPFAVLLWRRRRQDDLCTLPMLAATAVAARLFTYHNSIDNVVLAFLAVGLAVQALRTQQTLDVAWAAATVCTLMLPYLWTASALKHAVLFAVWVGGAAHLLRRALPLSISNRMAEVSPARLRPIAGDQ